MKLRDIIDLKLKYEILPFQLYNINFNCKHYQKSVKLRPYKWEFEEFFKKIIMICN